MSLSVILQQMGVICILVAIGFALQKKNVIDALTSKKLSAIVVDVCNPALIMASILSGNLTATHADLLTAIALGAAFYALLILLGFIIPWILRVEPDKRRFYHLMTVYTNTGFLGIPVAKAILPANAILYVIVINVFYSLLFYTHGVTVLGRGKITAGGQIAHGFPTSDQTASDSALAKQATHGSSKAKQSTSGPAAHNSVHNSAPSGLSGFGHALKRILSPGTIMAVLSLVVFWYNVTLPPILANTIEYVGNATVFLSMTLLGVSIARSNLMTSVKDIRIWGYVFLRMLLVPVGIVFVMHALKFDPVATLAMCLMAAVPVGNLPMIQAEKIGEDTTILSSAIAVTTAVSIGTITILTSIFSGWLLG
ncbi:MAG: AEC family transporter [Acetatifactor sp.]|nr:AEC family transporter [Acetatifactor sp.]